MFYQVCGCYSVVVEDPKASFSYGKFCGKEIAFSQHLKHNIALGKYEQLLATVNIVQNVVVQTSVISVWPDSNSGPTFSCTDF